MTHHPYRRALPAENKCQVGRQMDEPVIVLNEIIKRQDLRIRRLEAELAQLRLERMRWRRETAR